MSQKINKNSLPRVKIVQKIYNLLMNPNTQVEYPKSQYKKFIKDLRIKNMILVTRTRKKIIGLEGFGLKIKKQEIIK